MSVTITATEVNKLRTTTGAGMMDCKKALTETNGDFEAAIDLLRKKGQKVAANRSDRDAKEGLVIAQTSGARGVVVPHQLVKAVGDVMIISKNAVPNYEESVDE